MKNEKKSNGTLVGILIGLLIALIIGGCLFATGTISFKTSTTSDNEQTNDNQSTTLSENSNNLDESLSINVNELTKISKSDYNFLKQEGTSDISFNLSVDGKININFENEITNISNAKDIILFVTPSEDSNLYILTEDGDIYKYNTTSYKSKDYNATKVNEYSNIKRMITYNTRKANAGGCDYIVLIDNNNKYYKLDSSCV
ncbi:MAG: hypothetical protein VZS44_07390 [Bacilli bacterium]|nr:hypothetical protein [Bacilli bacterium]